MGKFGIGARVRDRDGDLAEVIGKPRKGWREVRYSGGKFDGLTLEWLKSELEAVGLRLELGKTYVDRDGVQHGPLVANVSGFHEDTHPFACGNLSWRSDGGFLWDDSGKDGWDLVAQVVLPAEPAMPQFEVGQRVTVTTRGWGETTDAPYHATIFAVGDDIDLVFDGWDGGHDGDARDGSSNHYYYAASDIAPFTLEAGKFYRTRDGRKVGPMVSGHYAEEWPLTVEHYFDTKTFGKAWRIDGTFDPDRRSNAADIVAEWVEPAIVVEDATDPIPSALVVVAGKRYRGKTGAEYDVVDNSDNEFWPLRSNTVPFEDSRFWKVDGTAYNSDGRNGWATQGDPLVLLIEPQPKFKVGDVVNYTLSDEAWQGVTITQVPEYAGGIYIGTHPRDGEGGFYEDQIVAAPIDLVIGNAVTAAGYISGANGNNFSVVFGDRSYDLPATALKKAA